jgi:hypothetical protein
MKALTSRYIRISFLNQLSLSETKQINLFFLGFILYSLGFALAATGLINYIVCSSIQVVGVFLFFPAIISLINFRIENGYLRILFYLYLCYLITIIFRGFIFEYYLMRNLLIDAWYGLFIYATPLVFLFPMKLGFFKKLIDATKLFAILSLLIFLLFSAYILLKSSDQAIVMTEIFSRSLGLAAGFVLFTFPYHSWKTNTLSFAVIISIFMLATFHGRRGLMLYMGLILMIAGLIYLSRGENRLLMGVILLMLFSSVVLVGAEAIDKSSLFSTVMDRGLEDTRSTVAICFYEDMSDRDWLIGKGLMGQYFCPGIDWDETTLYRSVIETGFLQIILKGGVISLALLLLIMIPAAFLGIFFSENLISRAFGLWIFVGIVNMYPSSVDTFTLNYLMMWIGVAVCYSSEIRNLNDATVMQYLKKL